MQFPSLLRHDDRGTSIVELALVAPIVLAMFAGILDCARLYSTKIGFQQAAERAVEIATTGGISSTGYTTLQTNMQNDATAAAPKASSVSASLWLECAGVKQSDFNGACNTGDQVARYASVTVSGSYTPSFPWLFGSMVSNGKITISGAATARVQ